MADPAGSKSIRPIWQRRKPKRTTAKIANVYAAFKSLAENSTFQ
jgi:hypothetical protein